MSGTDDPALRIGDWRVDGSREQISRDGKTVKLERRSMQLLLCLAEHAGQILSVDELLDRVWVGVVVTPDSVYQAIASLRRTLGDDPKKPTYISSIPRRGYSLVAPVAPWSDPPEPTISDSPTVDLDQAPAAFGLSRTRSRLWRVAIATSCAALILSVGYLVVGTTGL